MCPPMCGGRSRTGLIMLSGERSGASATGTASAGRCSTRSGGRRPSWGGSDRAGLEVPDRSPRQTDPGVVEHALAVRAWLVGQGLNAGTLSVGARMKRQGLTPPSRATLARAFAAAGVSKPEPRKRPRAANRRFVYPAPNCCWQIDSFAWSLADGASVAIHQVIDDHTRMAVSTLVAGGETAKAAVQVVSTAVRRWGTAQRLLSDNGLAFNPTRRGFTGKLVDYLLGLGVKPITGKPNRPTTQGKNERFHQTPQKWLDARPPVMTIAALQEVVDAGAGRRVRRVLQQ